MLVRSISSEEKDFYNQVVGHPLQSWEWGEFKKLNGQRLERIGFFDKGKLVNAIEVTFHQVPGGQTVGYLPKGPMPDEEQLKAIEQIAQKHQAIFVKLEPNVMIPAASQSSAFASIEKFLTTRGAARGKSLFTPYTFLLDLSGNQDDLFAKLHSKTRYNIRVANRHGVKVVQETNDKGFEIYAKLLSSTSQRQGFFIHNTQYHRNQWNILKNTDIPHIFLAKYQDKILSAFMIFKFKNKIYYPYGASLDIDRQVMAPNLLMWEVIKWGKKQKCISFDMWG
ncbi:MAG: peptidoglycan bridge formation glycyltransferase FemA/FemB family protein, partial [Candidatus Moranbacteria bacterium]|nr:peptidoglycan bridge formation glycyltransferase FemA/FemB family protein [Candidatus Moranbacteria bacterium]